MIYSQTAPSARFKNECTFSSCDVAIDDTNFINFDKIKGQSDFTFKLQWESDGKYEDLSWKQAGNPLEANRNDYII